MSFMSGLKSLLGDISQVPQDIFGGMIPKGNAPPMQPINPATDPYYAQFGPQFAQFQKPQTMGNAQPVVNGNTQDVLPQVPQLPRFSGWFPSSPQSGPGGLQALLHGLSANHAAMQNQAVRAVDGYYPQDDGGQGDGMDNMLQGNYNNPQTSLYGPKQQGGMPASGQFGQATDPFGWQQQGQPQPIRQFPGQ